MSVVDELQEKMSRFSSSYFLVDLRNDREAFYSLTPEELKKSIYCFGGYVLNLIIDGELEKVNSIIDSLPDDSILKAGIIIVNPTVTIRDFIKKLHYLKSINMPIACVVLTAGRPTLLNGFNDFSRLGIFLERKRDILIDDIKFLYGTDCAEQIYNLSLAEYYYSINKLVEAELLVSSTLKTFYSKNEFRFLFVALYLEAKISFANGTLTKTESYIKEIKDKVTHVGKAEFSSNIDAAEVYLSLFNTNYELVANWLKTDAPDEIGDFNMLDLYRYMIKIRCYIVQENFSAAIGLIERLRPLLEQGRRHMDLCELDLLLTETLWASGKTDLAIEPLERALKIAKRRNYLRLVADEGVAIFPILTEYQNLKGESEFLTSVINLSRKMAIHYPLYLKPRYKNNENFSKQEVDFLKLLEQGKNYEEIASYLFISVNTVKYHVKKVYSKLGADNANQAVWKAKLLGLIK